MKGSAANRNSRRRNGMMPAACSKSRYSRIANRVTTATSNTKSQLGALKVASSTSGTSTSAVRTRFTRVPQELADGCFSQSRVSLGQAAVATLALLVLHDGLEQVPSAKLRPQRFRHINFRV